MLRLKILAECQNDEHVDIDVSFIVKAVVASMHNGLGFPHEFLKSKIVKNVTFGGTYQQYDGD